MSNIFSSTIEHYSIWPTEILRDSTTLLKGKMSNDDYLCRVDRNQGLAR